MIDDEVTYQHGIIACTNALKAPIPIIPHMVKDSCICCKYVIHTVSRWDAIQIQITLITTDYGFSFKTHTSTVKSCDESEILSKNVPIKETFEGIPITRKWIRMTILPIVQYAKKPFHKTECAICVVAIYFATRAFHSWCQAYAPFVANPYSLPLQLLSTNPVSLTPTLNNYSKLI